MISGCGIDIVCTERFLHWTENPPLMRRFFHPDELEDVTAVSKGKAAERLAVRFAAKEAFGKALGTGLSGFNLNDVCVLKDESGRPFLRLYGGAEKLFKKGGNTRVHLSLSHEKCYAVAQVILESELFEKPAAF
ncbi:holo-ACP synthase [Treponema sp. HNW]|uniref:holo-ACP synthase n=1 Tax=Treponema sp. HNW TaxID=3116654 RepID=UPI003D13B9DC